MGKEQYTARANNARVVCHADRQSGSPILPRPCTHVEKHFS